MRIPIELPGLNVDAVDRAIHFMPKMSTLRPLKSIGVIMPEELTKLGVMAQLKSRRSILLSTKSHIYKYPIDGFSSQALLHASSLGLKNVIVVSSEYL